MAGLLVGIDDTDSPEGGCTTALAGLVTERLGDLTPDGPPRLVRLNPNVPWKTRGNAALALRFLEACDLDAALSRVLAVVQLHARRHERTEPGIVVAHEPPAPALYDAAVTRIVERSEADAALDAVKARAWGGRGVIGAAAAIAWPAERTTWERIAYRDPARLGSRRDVDDTWVREIEWGYPSTFDTYDVQNAEVVAVPNGRDPVLWGIRGEDPDTLARASAILGPERPARETLFLTNQGTDDHLRDRTVGECVDRLSARVRGRVAAAPVERNGTVLVEVEDATGRIRCAAYPPTHAFRHVIRALRVGDDVTACGGIHAGADGRLTLGLEKMLVHATSPRAGGAPTCPRCHRTMESAGRAAGFRCRGCGTRSIEARPAVSVVRVGWHEVPASARRHLAMPLKRMA